MARANEQHSTQEAQAIRRPFLAAVNAHIGTVENARLRAALEAGSVERAMTVLGLDALTKETEK